MSARLVSAIALLAVASPLSESGAQTAPPALAGRHHVVLTVGVSARSSASTVVGTPGVSVESGAQGLLGGLGYAYWLDDRLAAGVRLTALDAGADVTVTGSGARVESGVVAAVLLGARYQLARLTASDALRPYLGVWAGPLVGSGNDVTAGSGTGVTAGTETTMCGLATIGADLSLGRSLTLTADVGYLLAGAFRRPIGARTDYSSPLFTVSLGFLLGRGHASRTP